LKILNVILHRTKVKLTKSEWRRLMRHNFSKVVKPLLIDAGVVDNTISYGDYPYPHIMFEADGVYMDKLTRVIKNIIKPRKYKKHKCQLKQLNLDL